MRINVKVSVVRIFDGFFYCNYFIVTNIAEAAPAGTVDHTLPVVFDATEDPSVNNLTRSDANCDKTGTCYDGECLNEVFYLGSA